MLPLVPNPAPAEISPVAFSSTSIFIILLFFDEPSTTLELTDLKKDTDVLNRAYNDAAGYTADFNLNLLRRIKDELGGELDISSFEHDAFYNEDLSRIEMHLVSRLEQSIGIGGQQFDLLKGESIHTENSYKYSIEEFIELAGTAGFNSLKTWTDADNYFSIHYMAAK